MKFFIALLITFLCWFSPVYSLDGVELFGYYEPSVMGTRIQNRSQQLFSNKLRIDLESAITDRITFAANFDYITYHGTTEWNILDFLSADITSQIPDEMQRFYTISFDDRQFLDNAYLKIAFNRFNKPIFRITIFCHKPL